MGAFVFGTQWEIEDLLSDAGRTVVFGVKHRRGRQGVLKLAVGSCEREDRFIREVTLSDAASTAGSPEVLGYGASDEVRYLISDRIPGDTLAVHAGARGGRFDLATALLIVERLAYTVERLHALGIVHRDLSPENVMVSQFGEVHVIDFGLSVRPGLVLDDDPPPPVGFAAPEQVAGDGDPLDPRGDVFSLGALLYYLVSGAIEPLRRLSDGTDLAVSLDEVGHLPFAVIDLFDGVLTREPHRRIATVSRLRRRVAGIREDQHSLSFITEEAC